MYSIRDIVKKSFIEGYSATDISFKTVALAIFLTAIIGIYIFLLYRIVTRKTFYSKNFNISLVGVAMITSAIIITIQSSIVVSLGMVGALSIVRFRTAIKDPMDLMFLFWSISTGIMCGAGFAEFAIILAILLTLIILILEKLPIAKAPMILVVNAKDLNCTDSILDAVKSTAYSYSIKSRNITSVSLDMTIEVRVKEPEKLTQSVMSIPDVLAVSLIEHTGEATF